MDSIDKIIQRLTNEVDKKIDKSFNKLQRMRYIYLTIAKYFEKYTDFFLNEKLDSLKLSKQEMDDIYNNKVNVVNKRGKDYYQIICRSSALILKGVLENFGVESVLANTTSDDDSIKHWFLVSKDDDNNQYFLNLSVDLPYIRNSFPTQHFAANMSYFFNYEPYENKEKSSQLKKRMDLIDTDIDDYVAYMVSPNQYVLFLKKDLEYVKFNQSVNFIELKDKSDILFDDSKVNIVYRLYEIPENVSLKKSTMKIGSLEFSFDEVEHIDLFRDKEKLEKLDNEIGYSKLYDTVNSDIISERNLLLTYYHHAEENSEISRIFVESFNMKKDRSKKIDDITFDEVVKFKRSINAYVVEQINKMHNLDLECLTSDCEGFINETVDKLADIDLSKEEGLRSKLKKLKKKSNDLSIRQLSVILLTVLNLEERFDHYIDLKTNLQHNETLLKTMLQDYHNSEEVDIDKENKIYELNRSIFYLENDIEKSKQLLSVKEIEPLIKNLSYYFIKDDINKEDSKEYIPNSYIYNKFTIMFPLLFECSYKDDIVNYNTNFSTQGYSEQIVIVKEMMKKCFSELNINNSSQIENYDYSYSAIENRMRMYPLKNRETGEYMIGFRIWATNPNYTEDTEMNLVYIPSLNLLKDVGVLELSKYLTVSSTLVTQIEDIENIGSAKIK